jgi:hypothetical protein
MGRKGRGLWRGQGSGIGLCRGRAIFARPFRAVGGPLVRIVLRGEGAEIGLERERRGRSYY